MQIPEIIEDIKTYKKQATPSKNLPTSYDRGLYNGLEIVLALIEKRPAFLLDKNNKLNMPDMEKYPEYFL